MLSLPYPSPRALLTFGLFVSLFVAAEGSAQVVLVEDFETPDTANYFTYFAPSQIVTATQVWDVVAESVDLYEDAARTEAVAFDGGQAVDLAGSPGAGVMETSFPTVPGTAYRLIFHYARNGLLGAETGDAQVDVEGGASLLSAVIQHDPALYSFDTHLQFSDTFIADDSQATLRFTSLDTGTTGITIDAISIAVDEPSVPSLSMPATLVLMLGLPLVTWLLPQRARAA